ncbi:ATP-dependent RNA helicase HrpA [Alkalilimnicola ehrlichii]|uniref:RNA helicase n=1 Tax=Alkalilimnicola ehrlichii TaxID=351052 RepID=A0A3E0X2J2_9GAMM|nr:ATP-dependent RNA helicase HrpA [Alkalilimnicola ehrlichii]RFA28363.1 ATP-dependent RNA helicase HrpA [Alkalilimnicola ehrlichii]RFA38572.1 ATP-dependent RNA helicase HrpA [Alkalilimnicola ehrlichii]
MKDRSAAQAFEDLAERLDHVMLAQRAVLGKRLNGLRRRARSGQPYDRGLEKLQLAIADAEAQLATRQAAAPIIDYPVELPVSEHRDKIAAALTDHQVVVVCGETGSGKSTQLPKLCLELGRGRLGMIAHTQPRRIAARSLAARIAEELGEDVGKSIGYKVRFTDRVGPYTLAKLVTDGMLLAEIQGDRDLLAYDTIIIDEAHERSLNIDFLLGYLKQLLPRRPDLKVIVTSATIDPDRFSRHFDNAPIIQVSGRTYPVEQRYRPLDERDQSAAIVEAVDELSREGTGDILVFLSGEREIRDAAEALRKHHPPHTEILPLFARLSTAEQARIFKPGGRRRIVLATNVAETSVTVPGIRYVVDTGFARISRYSYRTKVQRLPIEPISQASANQRSGRCGRIAPGICIRLYAEEDYLSRPEFTEPEIMRTNLASVILQMKAWRLGDVDDFPFVEAPDGRFINDGFKLLYELGAVDRERELTELGHRLARFPVDPRIGRMLLAAEREGCLRELLVIGAALSVQDPRERPLEAQQAADEAHAAYRDERSDFVSHLKLWDDFREQAKHLSRRKLMAYCRERFIAFKRMLEWQDIHRQLKELVKGMGLRENELPADYSQIHRALLSGLLSNVALKAEEAEYTGPRNVKLHIHPGSGLFKRKPKWIMAAELVETRRLYARDVAEVRPEWIEQLAPHLVQRSYAEPHWQPKAARVAAFESVSLYGLVLVARRKVNFSRIDPVAAREIFIREGLVYQRYRSRGQFQSHNKKLIESIERIEAKARRRDVLVDEEAVYAFYDERVPGQVNSGAAFERWRSEAEKETPKLLFMSQEQLMQRPAHEVGREAFPDRLSVRGMPLPLEYHFEPGDPLDGVTVRVPLPALNQLPVEPFDWLVPGLIREKLIVLIRSLPKQLRRNFVPAPDFADAVLEAVTPGEGRVAEVLRQQLKRITGVEVPLDAWDKLELPAHLRMNFRVLGGDGKTLALGRSLNELKDRLSGHASEAFSSARDSDGIEQHGLRHWSFGDLPVAVESVQHGVTIKGYPTVIDEGDSVALKVCDAPEEAERALRAGVRRLFMLALNQQTKYLRRNLPGLSEMCLRFASVGSCEALREDILAASFDRVFMPDGVALREAAEFERRLEEGRSELVATSESLCRAVAPALEHFHQVQKQVKRPSGFAQMESYADLKEQLEHLIYVGFVSATPYHWLQHLPRFLEGAERRLNKLRADPARDQAGLSVIRPLWQRYLERRALHAKKGIDDPALQHFRWLLEEYRISLFAQELRTSVPISGKRLEQAWKDVV